MSNLGENSTNSVVEQNKIGSRFNQHNIRHLFVDSNGTYCSSTKIDPCIASGIFFNEFDIEQESTETMHDEFKRIREMSEKAGYSVLRGMKEIGASVPSNHFKEN